VGYASQNKREHQNKKKIVLPCVDALLKKIGHHYLGSSQNPSYDAVSFSHSSSSSSSNPLSPYPAPEASLFLPSPFHPMGPRCKQDVIHLDLSPEITSRERTRHTMSTLPTDPMMIPECYDLFVGSCPNSPIMLDCLSPNVLSPIVRPVGGKKIVPAYNAEGNLKYTPANFDQNHLYGDMAPTSKFERKRSAKLKRETTTLDSTASYTTDTVSSPHPDAERYYSPTELLKGQLIEDYSYAKNTKNEDMYARYDRSGKEHVPSRRRRSLSKSLPLENSFIHKIKQEANERILLQKQRLSYLASEHHEGKFCPMQSSASTPASDIFTSASASPSPSPLLFQSENSVDFLEERNGIFDTASKLLSISLGGACHHHRLPYSYFHFRSNYRLDADMPIQNNLFLLADVISCQEHMNDGSEECRFLPVTSKKKMHHFKRRKISVSIAYRYPYDVSEPSFWTDSSSEEEDDDVKEDDLDDDEASEESLGAEDAELSDTYYDIRYKISENTTSSESSWEQPEDAWSFDSDTEYSQNNEFHREQRTHSNYSRRKSGGRHKSGSLPQRSDIASANKQTARRKGGRSSSIIEQECKTILRDGERLIHSSSSDVSAIPNGDASGRTRRRAVKQVAPRRGRRRID